MHARDRAGGQRIRRGHAGAGRAGGGRDLVHYSTDFVFSGTGHAPIPKRICPSRKASTPSRSWWGNGWRRRRRGITSLRVASLFGGKAGAASIASSPASRRPADQGVRGPHGVAELRGRCRGCDDIPPGAQRARPVCIMLWPPEHDMVRLALTHRRTPGPAGRAGDGDARARPRARAPRPQFAALANAKLARGRLPDADLGRRRWTDTCRATPLTRQVRRGASSHGERGVLIVNFRTYDDSPAACPRSHAFEPAAESVVVDHDSTAGLAERCARWHPRSRDRAAADNRLRRAGMNRGAPRDDGVAPPPAQPRCRGRRARHAGAAGGHGGRAPRRRGVVRWCTRPTAASRPRRAAFPA